MKVLTSLLLLSFYMCPVYTQDKAQNQDKQLEFYRTPAPETAIYRMFQALVQSKNWTFLLNSYTGEVWIRVNDEGVKWKKTVVDKLPKLKESKVSYQIFLSQHGQAGFFLLCLETGDTWFLRPNEENLTWVHIPKEEKGPNR